MPRKSSRRKPTRRGAKAGKSSRRKPARRGAKAGKSSGRKPARKSSRRKPTSKSSRRKPARKSSRRKPTRRGAVRKANGAKGDKAGKSPIRKSPTTSGRNEYSFAVWYFNKPKVNNKLTVINPIVKLDDDDEWVFSGFVKANSIEEAKAWLRSLGSIKNYSGTSEEALDITVF